MGFAPLNPSYATTLQCDGKPMSWGEDAINRLDALIQEGTNLPIERSPESSVFDSVEYGSFFGWRTKVITALQALLDKEHPYTEEFVRLVNDTYLSSQRAGVSILQSLRSDIEAGYLEKLANIVSAEVFGDFLDMARHLLDAGYHHPAASLAGAVRVDRAGQRS